MPRQKTNGTFASLQEEHHLWKALEEKPLWWRNILNDPELYVEIRKDNYINVYYYGGCVALIQWSNGHIVAEIHKKYTTDHFDTKGQTITSNYYDCQELFQSQEGLEAIKRRISQVYHKLPAQEGVNNRKNIHISSEKIVQGELILCNRNRYIDSELAHQTEGRKTMRIDLVELKHQALFFVELKLITDSRLRHLDSQPEIMAQMKKYHDFINRYQEEIIRYYQKILQIKRRIGIWTGETIIKEVSHKPKLLIIDTYSQMTKGRETRIANIRELLETGQQHFNFFIQKYQQLCK